VILFTWKMVSNTACDPTADKKTKKIKGRKGEHFRRNSGSCGRALANLYSVEPSASSFLQHVKRLATGVYGAGRPPPAHGACSLPDEKARLSRQIQFRAMALRVVQRSKHRSTFRGPAEAQFRSLGIPCQRYLKAHEEAFQICNRNELLIAFQFSGCNLKSGHSGKKPTYCTTLIRWEAERHKLDSCHILEPRSNP
jgi:hypothetical protein